LDFIFYILNDYVQLKEENVTQKKENDQLKEENVTQKKENDQLKKEIEYLKQLPKVYKIFFLFTDTTSKRLTKYKIHQKNY
jgi:cell division protein FtsB